MSDPFQLAVMPDDLTDGLQALVELVAEIDYWARLSVTHGQQCRSLADFCDNVVDQLEVNANECITTFTGEEREHHMDCYREYIAQTKYGLEQALGQVREISERREIDALADPYKTVSSIVGCCVALADCASRFAITSQLGLLEWVKELAIAAKADQTMLVDIVSREHDVITCMRLLQVRMRAFDQESEECRKAEETLRNLQRKVDMPLLPLADLVLEAREIDGAPVGNSTTAQIRKGKWLNDVNTVVALKYLHPHVLTEKQVTKFHRKVEIVRSVQHRNIMQLYGVCYTKTMCLVYPWMNNGNVVKYVAEHPEADRMRLILEVARGLEHLHAQNPPMVHGALEPNNVFVDDEHCAIVADSTLTEEFELLAERTYGGGSKSMRYQAPEAHLWGIEISMLAGDVYAWAMTALHVISGRQPFSHQVETGSVVIAVSTGKRPDIEQYEAEELTDQQRKLLGECWKLLEDCWVQDPAERLQMTQVVQRIEEMRLDLVNTWTG